MSLVKNGLRAEMTGLSEDELRWQIDNFLRDFKNLVWESRYRVRGHEKNKQGLIDLGITIQQREEIIRSLTLENYCKGPQPDIYHPGEVYWEFGAEINSVSIYIKLQIVTLANGNDWAFCLSFHPAEFPIKYHFRPKKPS